MDTTYLFLEALRLTFEELISYLPRIVFSIGIAIIYILIAIVMGKFVRKIFKLTRLEEAFKPLLKEAVSITDLAVMILNIGLALLAAYTLVSILLPEYLSALTSIVEYVARIVSVVFIVFFTFILLNTIVEKIRMETKIKGFMLLTTLFITLILVIDVTAVSEEVKTSLTWGISLGLGLAIGVFAIWFFFHESFEKGK